MGDFPGHPFRGNQHTDVSGEGVAQGRKDAADILRSPGRPGVGGKRREPAEELRAQAAYHLRMADEQLRDKSAPEHIRVAASQFSIGRAEGLAAAAKEYEAGAADPVIARMRALGAESARLDREDTERNLKAEKERIAGKTARINAERAGVTVQRGDYRNRAASKLPNGNKGTSFLDRRKMAGDRHRKTWNIPE